MPRISTDDNNLAAGGYDVVGYFSANRAIEGSSAFETSHEGATYRFSSAENLAAFCADPGKYAPAFGGFCPFGAVMMGQCVPTDPKTFRVQDGRLLLFFNDMWEGQMFDTSQKWDEDPKGMLTKADAVWAEVSAK